MARIGGYATALVSHPCTCSEGRRTPLRGAEVGNRRAHQKLPGLGDRETTHQNRHVDRTGCDDRQPPSQTSQDVSGGAAEDQSGAEASVGEAEERFEWLKKMTRWLSCRFRVRRLRPNTTAYENPTTAIRRSSARTNLRATTKATTKPRTAPYRSRKSNVCWTSRQHV